MPYKNNIKRVISQLDPETVYNNVYEGRLTFTQCRKSIFCSKPWEPGARTVTIQFNQEQDSVLLNYTKIRVLAPKAAKEMITKLITVYWDCFTEEVIKGLIIGFAFAIGVGKHTMDVAKNRNMVHKKQRSL